MRTVVVADDDDELRDLIADILDGVGYDVIPARSGKQVVDYLAAVDVPPLAIVLDLLMPLMSGWEVLNLIRSRRDWCEIPIIVLTGLSGDRPTRIAGVLKKPFRVDELLSALAVATTR